MGPATVHVPRPASPDTIHAPLRVPTSNTGPTATLSTASTYAVVMWQNLLKVRDELEVRTGGIGDLRQPTVRRVLGGQDDRPAEVDDLGERGVRVLDSEVDRPVRGHPVGQECRRVHDAGQPAVALTQRRVAELRDVADN